MAKGVWSAGMDISSMKALLEAVGGDVRACENRTAWLHRIADAAGLHYRTVRAAWHGEILSFKTAYALKAAIKNEQFKQDVADRYEALARRLLKADPEFYRDAADAYFDLAGRVRGSDRGKD